MMVRIHQFPPEQINRSIAQSGRALRLGRSCREFESLYSDQGDVVQQVEQGLHMAYVGGSIPSITTKQCMCSSVGRASRCQRECRRFDPDHMLQLGTVMN
jgi:hypothetical protein